jgi:hypothetical protein
VRERFERREWAMSKAKSSSGGGCGCVSLILTCVVVWAVIFGVTIGGKHYGMSCSCKRGVDVIESVR